MTSEVCVCVCVGGGGAFIAVYLLSDESLLLCVGLRQVRVHSQHDGSQLRTLPGVLQRPAVGARTPRKDQRLPTYVAALSLDDPRVSVVAGRVRLL